MVSKLRYIFVLTCILHMGKTDSVEDTESIERVNARYAHIDSLIEDLQDVGWDNDEKLCFEQLLTVMSNVRNSTLWATMIWDSMQLPVGHLYGNTNNYGNYDECVEFPWERLHSKLRTQYCLASIKLSEVELLDDNVDLMGSVQNYIRTQTKYHLKFNTLNWGVCTPAVCKPHSVSKLVGVLFRHTYLGAAVEEPLISVEYCDQAGDVEDTGNLARYFTLFFVLFLFCLSLLCTLYVNFKDDLKSTGFIFSKVFDIPTNVKSLVRISDNDLQTMFGMRAMSSCIVVILHVWLATKLTGVANAVSLNKDFESAWLYTLLNFEGVVDTFFFMSAFLLTKSFKRTVLKPFNPLKVIVKRYIRMMFPILLTVLIVVKTIKLPKGPARKVYDKEIQACDNNWWTIPLMVQNYYDPENMCYPLLWSIPCDFHLQVIGVMILWLLVWSRKVGFIVFLAAFTASIALPAELGYRNPEQALLHLDFRVIGDFRKYLTGVPIYTATHLRAGSYFVGMAFGYLMSTYKPVHHRKIISMKYSVLGFIVYLCMFIGLLVVGNNMAKFKHTPVEIAMYVSMKRIVWATLIGILITICEYGTLPLVTSFMSWPIWIPISRLSFGTYLTHPIFILYPVVISRVPLQYEMSTFCITSAGVMVFSIVSSLCLWTFFEAPLQNILYLICKNISKPTRGVKDIKVF